MILYHGSKNLFSVLKRKKAWGPDGTPPAESLNMIYFTSDFSFALASAARPEGITEVNNDEKTIHFENPDKFDPEKEIYIYSIDSSKILSDKQKQIDKWQIIVDLDEIKPDSVETYKASEIRNHYKII